MPRLFLHRGFWIALGIQVLALALRWWRLDLIDFRYDEAAAALFARQIADGARFTLAPHSGSVLPHPPGWLYALSLPYFFADNILFTAAWRATWDAAAVGVLMLAVRKSIGMRAALVAGLLLAVAPWMVWYSRKLWVSVSPLSCSLLLLGLAHALAPAKADHTAPDQDTRAPSMRGWWLAGVAAAGAVAGHWNGALMLPALAFAALQVGGRRWLAMLAVVTPSALVVLAYVLVNGTPAARLMTAATDVVSGGASPWQVALIMISGTQLGDLSGQSFEQWRSMSGSTGFEILGLLAIACCALALLGLISVWKRFNIWVHVCAILLATPVLIFGLPIGRGLQPQYILPFLPAAFALIAAVANHAIQAQPIMLRRAIITTLLVIGIGQVAGIVRFNTFLEQFPTTSHMPVSMQLEAAKHARSAGSQLLAVVPADQPDTESEAAAWTAALPRGSVRLSHAGSGLILADATYASLRSLRILAALNGTESLLPNGLILKDVRCCPTLRQPPSARTSARWASGHRLVAADVIKLDANTLRVTLQLTLDDAGAPDLFASRVHFSAQLRDSAGTRIGQADNAAFAPNQLRRSDQLLLQWDVPMQGHASQVAIVAYAYPDTTAIGIELAPGDWRGEYTLRINP